jgi:flagellar motor switch protein FliG
MIRSKAKGVTDPAKLTGPEKAAVVLLALGEDHAQIWQQLDDDEIKEISQAMASLGTVQASVVEDLLVEFVSGMSSTGAIMGSFEQTQRLLASIMPPDKVEQLMEEIRGPAGRTMWDKLGNVNEAVLANYLKNEYPQTVAVVLSKIKSEHAARVLAALPEDFALECVMRMLRMEPVQREILDKIEQTLRTEFMSNLARTSKRDSHEMMADIFNAFDRQTEARFLTALEERNREAAERIRALRGPGQARSRRRPDPAAVGGEGPARPGPQGRLGQPAGNVLLQHVRAGGQDHARGHGDHGSRAPARRGPGADGHRAGGQGPRQQGRDHAGRRRRRR